MEDSTYLFDRTTVERLPALNDLDKAELIKKIWPDTILNRSVFEDFSYTAILEHFVNELDQVRYHSRLFAAQTFEELFKIIEYLKQNGAMKYTELAEQVQTWYPQETLQDNVRRSIELAVRIWLTVNVHSSSIFVGPISAGDVPNEWPLDYSLERLLQSIFGRRIQIQPRKQPRCDPVVTIAYLMNTCGMKVGWTDDMASHLQFDIRSLELTVYRHKACLISHIEGPDKCPVSSDVLEEILDTMDLLLPPWDNATKQLLRKEGQQSLYTLGCRKPTRVLDLSRYKYFGEQLEYLIESFSETPRTWKQLALDRRNKSEWSVFWVTVLIGILTLVTIPCNIIQATYSIKAYNVAVAQAQSSNTDRP